MLTHLKEKLQFVQKENEVLREELEGLDSLVRTFLMEYLGILRIDIYNSIYVYGLHTHVQIIYSPLCVRAHFHNLICSYIKNRFHHPDECFQVPATYDKNGLSVPPYTVFFLFRCKRTDSQQQRSHPTLSTNHFSQLTAFHKSLLSSYNLLPFTILH